MNITKSWFKELTGRESKSPEELQKVNCYQAGSYGHMDCGFCWEHNVPMTECMCAINNASSSTPIEKILV